MKTNKLSILFFLIVSFFSSSTFAQAYEIKVSIKNLSNAKIILGHHFNKNLYPDDTVELNANGTGILTGKNKLPGGMYLLFLPNRTYLDFMISGDNTQNFEIESDTSNFLETVKFKNSPENDVFYNYQRFLRTQSKKSEQYRKEKENNKENTEKLKESDNKLENLNKEVKDEINKIYSTNPNYVLSKFLKSTLEIDVPEKLSDINKFHYYKKHYFDNFDYTDSRLLRTPIYDEKFKLFIEKILPQIPDTVIPYVDTFLKNTRQSKELFRYILITLHNFYANSQIMGIDKVFVHIAENYYIPEADWSDKKYLDKIKKEVIRIKPTLIGNIAPEFKMQSLPKDTALINTLKKELSTVKILGDAPYKVYENALKDAKNNKETFKKDSTTITQQLINELIPIMDTWNDKLDDFKSLQQVEAQYTILWFWDPECGHCTKETPILANLYKKFESKGLHIHSVLLNESVIKWDKYYNQLQDWMDFIKTHHLEKWTNLIDPYGNTQFREKYNIIASPQALVLDKGKKILAKRIDIEQINHLLLDEYIRTYSTQEKGKRLIAVTMDFTNDFSQNSDLLDIKFAIERYYPEKEKNTLVKYVEKRRLELLKTAILKHCNSTDKNKVQKLKDFVEDFKQKEDLDLMKKIILEEYKKEDTDLLLKTIDNQINNKRKEKK